MMLRQTGQSLVIRNIKRLQESEAFTDVIFHCSDKINISAHKVNNHL